MSKPSTQANETQEWEINHSHRCQTGTLLSTANDPSSKCHFVDKLIPTNTLLFPFLYFYSGPLKEIFQNNNNNNNNRRKHSIWNHHVIAVYLMVQVEAKLLHTIHDCNQKNTIVRSRLMDAAVCWALARGSHRHHQHTSSLAHGHVVRLIVVTPTPFVAEYLPIFTYLILTPSRRSTQSSLCLSSSSSSSASVLAKLHWGLFVAGLIEVLSVVCLSVFN